MLARAVGSCVTDPNMNRALFACALLAACAAHADGALESKTQRGDNGAELCKAECKPIVSSVQPTAIAPEMDWPTAIAAFSLLAGGAFILKVRRTS
jgi:hypothetical protein